MSLPPCRPGIKPGLGSQGFRLWRCGSGDILLAAISTAETKQTPCIFTIMHFYVNGVGGGNLKEDRPRKDGKGPERRLVVLGKPDSDIPIPLSRTKKYSICRFSQAFDCCPPLHLIYPI